jgi:pSer/pThr/pTyr-binding forkhead associated (FHA) protein
MAKLTVYFRNSVIQSFPLEIDKPVHIGRAETNDLVIDSSAVASAHATVVIRNGICAIKQLNNDFPLTINGEKIKMATLQHGDTISIGDHEIVYSTGELDSAAKQPSANRKPSKNSYISHIANYQIIKGVNIGKIFHLKSPMMVLGEPGQGLVAITKRKEGYFASILENVNPITINDVPLGNRTQLINHNDILVIGNNMSVQFYLQ